MYRYICKSTWRICAAASLLLGLLAASASAQSPAVDIAVLDVNQLHDTMEAQILDADYDERTLTIRFESSNETAKLIIPENAELIRRFPNDLERQIEIDKLHPGDEIEVQGVEINGVMRLRILGFAS